MAPTRFARALAWTALTLSGQLLVLSTAGCGLLDPQPAAHARVAEADALVGRISETAAQEAAAAVRASSSVLGASSLPADARIAGAQEINDEATCLLPKPTPEAAKRWDDAADGLIAGNRLPFAHAAAHADALVERLRKEKGKADALARQLAAAADAERQRQADIAALNARNSRLLMGFGMALLVLGGLALYRVHLRLGLFAVGGAVGLFALAYGLPTVPAWAWVVGLGASLIVGLAFAWYTYRVGLYQRPGPVGEHEVASPAEGGAAQ